MVAAVTAARRGKTVLILERSEKVGKKLLATGNGKCNMANISTLEGKYNTSEVNGVLTKCNLVKQIEFWNSVGVLTKEVDGRIYPYSEQASSVLNALRRELDVLNVKVECGTEVTEIFKGYSVNGFKAKNVLLATGSSASFGKDSGFLFEKFEHLNTSLNGALVPMLTDTVNLKGLRGVRVKAGVKLLVDGKEVASTQNEIIFKDNGVSGTAIFTLSSHLARSKGKASLVLDLMPEYSLEEVRALIKKLGTVEHLFHKELVNNIIRLAKDGCLEKTIKHYPISNVRLGSKELAQVMSGGLELRDFNLTTLESKLSKGLYASGEVLNVDGECGGYNVMWAVASGMTVGENV